SETVTQAAESSSLALLGIFGYYPLATNHYPLLNRIPTMLADIRFASVPAIMARKPSLARSLRRLGARALSPPIWMPMEPKLANPHRANVAMVNDRGSSAA